MTDVLNDDARQAAETERLRRLFRIFGATQARGRSAVYEALSDGVAGDDRLLGLMLDTPADQRRPSLLFGAVNRLLASDPGSALAAYYPIHGGRRTVDDRLLPAFSDFCGQHRDALQALLRTRSTQTNEIRRCVALRLGLEHVARRWPGPLSLVEIGASAGLNLLFDRYDYRLGGDEAAGAAASPVVIACDIRGGAPGAQLLGTAPQITTRLGVDQSPIDLPDPAARAWLEAFIWPEQTADLATLRAAIALALSQGVTVTRGDAVTDTARMLGELPGQGPAVVFTASLLSYLTAAARAAFLAQLDEAARRRPVAWVFAEGPGLLATLDLDLDALAGPLARRNTLYLVGASLRGASPDDRLLAIADPYVRWLAPARGAGDDFQWVSDDG